MRYLVSMAFDSVYPNLQIKFSNSIAMGIYGRAVNGVITAAMIDGVITEMHRLIALDLPIVRKKITIADAKKYYRSKGYLDKVETLNYRKQIVNIYECQGYRNYMYGYMVP